MNTNILLKLGGIVIIDDTDFPYISEIVDSYILSGCYEEVKMFPKNEVSPHRFCRKLK